MTPARLHLVPEPVALPDLPAASHELPDLLIGRPCDPRRFRELYPALWSEFLHAHFRDPLQVAVMLGCDEKTCRLWWEGKGGPLGWAVNFMLRTVPNAASELGGK